MAGDQNNHQPRINSFDNSTIGLENISNKSLLALARGRYLVTNMCYNDEDLNALFSYL